MNKTDFWMPTLCSRRVFIVVIIVFIALYISVSLLGYNGIQLSGNSTAYYVGKIKSQITSQSPANQSNNLVGQIRHGHTEKPGVQDGDNAVVRIDEQILTMIAEIKASDTRTRANGTLEPRNEVSCLPRSPTGIEDILCMTPPTFLPSYKNPCWYGSDGVFRCLPYFQVIGMDKSGSTDLFDRIARHPDVLKNKGVLGKETMWWSWRRYGHWLKQNIKVQTFQQYIRYFSNASKRIEKDTEARLITGDGTPMDLWDNSGWTSIPQNHGLREPGYTTPHLIRHVNPHARLIVVLRDPVERLYSDYFFLGLGKMTADAFHDNVIKSIKILHNCTRTHSLRACLYSRQLHIDITARLHLGFYAVFLSDWLRVFPRDQLLILQTEDFAANTSHTVKRAFEFLNLHALSQSELDKVGTASRKYVTKRKQKAGAIKTETKRILQHLYDSFNVELYNLLGDTKFLWNTTL